MILLDTHALLWWTGIERSKLSSSALATIEAFKAPGTVLISSISSWEIALLLAQSRLRLDIDLLEWLEDLGKLSHVRFIPVDNAIAVEANRLPDYPHRDPADRIIIATARLIGVPLVTADEKIRAYPHVDTVW